MRRTLRASPAAIRRATDLYRPLTPRQPLAERPRDVDQHQLKLSQESQQSQVNRSQK